MGDIINGVASEYEMPREPKFYPSDSKLPITNCNVPMPNVKPPATNGDRICDTRNKEDVCMYKGELAQAAKEITQISERVNGMSLLTQIFGVRSGLVRYQITEDCKLDKSTIQWR